MTDLIKFPKIEPVNQLWTVEAKLTITFTKERVTVDVGVNLKVLAL